jgi:hypothetical protein
LLAKGASPTVEKVVVIAQPPGKRALISSSGFKVERGGKMTRDGGFWPVRTTESQRLVLVSLAATAALAFALGVATALWALSPHMRTAAERLPPSGAAAHILPSAAAAASFESSSAAASGATDAEWTETASSNAPDQAISPVVRTEPVEPAAEPAQAPPAADSQTALFPAAAPAQAPSVAPLLLPGRHHAYQVHLGAFRNPQAADRLRNMVNDRGFEIAIVERPIGTGETLLLAVSAAFADRTDALRLAARLHREIGIDPLVIRVPAIAGDTG